MCSRCVDNPINYLTFEISNRKLKIKQNEKFNRNFKKQKNWLRTL